MLVYIPRAKPRNRGRVLRYLEKQCWLPEFFMKKGDLFITRAYCLKSQYEKVFDRVTGWWTSKAPHHPPYKFIEKINGVTFARTHAKVLCVCAFVCVANKQCRASVIRLQRLSEWPRARDQNFCRAYTKDIYFLVLYIII